MRGGYGFSAALLGKCFARIIGGYACRERVEQITLTQHTRIGISGWWTFTSRIRFNPESNRGMVARMAEDTQ
jgi:hypothetical protein